MKLLHIANRNYIITLVGVFLLGSALGYFVLKSIVNEEFNQKLFAEKDQLIYELQTYEDLKSNFYLNIGDKIQMREVNYDSQMKPMLSDTIMFDEFEKRELPFRTLTFSSTIQGKFYVIRITKSLLSNVDLMKGIMEIMMFVVTILAISLIVINRFVSRKIWNPFYQILNDLKDFKISNPEPLASVKSNVEEFRALKRALNSMINKSIRDYRNLKEYTENTSHEIQTPLAIIRNKSEILLQEPLTERQTNEIGKIYEAAGRLSKLKDGLSLLTKIDNNQFVSVVQINLKEFILKKLNNFDELIKMKELTVSTKFIDDPVIELNNDLAYMMITNLLSNSIKHNVPKGKINIILNTHVLRIENTGNDPKVPTNELFDRFRRSGKEIDSVGLGLSLIKRIANYYNLSVDYTYQDNWHTIKIFF